MRFERAIVVTAAAVALVSVVRVGALGGWSGQWDASVEVRAARDVAQVEPGERLTLSQVVSVLRVAGWPESAIPNAVDVAGCESDWRPDVVGSAGERGLFQIHPMHDHRFDIDGAELDPLDPVHNAAAALAIWKLYGWEPWTCQPGLSP